MPRCPNTHLTMPECSCPRCLRRQMHEFAPADIAMKVDHDPPLMRDVRPAAAAPPPVAERLMRPAI